MSSDKKLPPLREDLELISLETGDASIRDFIVRDVRSNTYIRIGRDTARLLHLWEGGLDWDVFLKRVADNGLAISPDELATCIRDLARAQFFDAVPERVPQKNPLQNITQQIIKNYLFFKIPLFYPDRFIARLLPWVEPLFSRLFLSVTAALGLIALFYAVPQWERLVSALSVQGNLETTIKFAIALVIAKSVHELAHAFAAARKGCHVGSLGIGFMLGAPIFYADVTDTWRLSRPNDRIGVAAAGITAELCLAVYATFIWLLNINPIVNDIALFMALATWTSTLVVNANPLMRFDGYYIFSDALGIANLQSQGFASVGAFFRRVVFGLDEAKKYPTIVFAYGLFAVIYRVIVVTSIAFLLYYFVFRALGLILFVLEIWIFLLGPLIGQFRIAWRNRKKIKPQRALTASFCLVIILSIGLFAPLNRSVEAPAVVTRALSVPLFTQIDGQTVRPVAPEPVFLSRDQNIVSLKNPFLAIDLQVAEIELRVAKERFERLSFAPQERDAYFGLAAEMERAQIKVERLREQVGYLSLAAPGAGLFLPRHSFAIGDVVANKAPLGTLIMGSAHAIGFVSEHDLARIQRGSNALYFDDLDMRPRVGQVIAIERFAAERLRFPQLASVYGGPIRSHGNLQAGLSSDTALYRVIVDLGGHSDVVAVHMGRIAISAQSIGLVPSLWRELGHIFRREAYLD